MIIMIMITIIIMLMIIMIMMIMIIMIIMIMIIIIIQKATLLFQKPTRHMMDVLCLHLAVIY